MAWVNENFAALQDSYLFSQVAYKVADFSAAHPEKKIIRLGIGDVTLPLAPVVVEAMQKAVAEMGVKETFRGYGPEQGYGFLHEALVKYYAGLGVELDSSEIFISDGAKSDCGNITDIFDDANVILVPDPVYPVYLDTNIMRGRKILFMEGSPENHFLPMPDPAVKADIIYLCSPNNPTGTIYSDSRMDEIVAVLREYPEISILSDEIYNGLTYGTTARSWAYYTDLAERLIVVNGVSKTYAMTGYRIGWMMCKNTSFIAACTRLQSQQFTCATMIAQKAAEAALTADQESVSYLRTEFQERRDLICRLAREVKGWRFVEPHGAFYLFPDVSAIGNGDEVAEMLLEKAHVAVVPGSAFGCPECIRLSYAISTEEIEETMRRIKNVFM